MGSGLSLRAFMVILALCGVQEPVTVPHGSTSGAVRRKILYCRADTQELVQSLHKRQSHKVGD